MILIAFGSATIGLIRHNRALVDEVEDATLLDSEEAEADLLLTVLFTMSTASWIIFLAGCVAIGETIALILQLMRGGTIRTVLNVFVSYDADNTIYTNTLLNCRRLSSAS